MKQKNNFKYQHKPYKNTHDAYNYNNVYNNLPYGSIPGYTGFNYTPYTASYSPFTYNQPAYSIIGEFVVIRAILSDNQKMFICMNDLTDIGISDDFDLNALFCSNELLNISTLIKDFCIEYNNDNPGNKICKVIVDKMYINPTGSSFTLYEEKE